VKVDGFAFNLGCSVSCSVHLLLRMQRESEGVKLFVFGMFGIC
jgi:hypothetical protein